MSKVLLIAILVIAVVSGLYVYQSYNKNRKVTLDTDSFNNTLTISSPAFKLNEKIPSQYTCSGEGKFPPIKIQGVSSASKSLALIIDDPDAPLGTFTHFVAWNIPPETKLIDSINSTKEMVVGRNSEGKSKYTPFCPPVGQHRYFFKVFGLNKTVSLDQSANRKDLEKELGDSLTDKGEFYGVYVK